MTNPSPIFHLPGAPFGPFSEAYFSLTGTTTPHAVFVDAALTTEHPNPLVSDEDGLFPDVFLDPDYRYRLRIIAEGGDLNNPPLDHDPINDAPFGLTDDDIADALGYVPVDPEDARFTGEARLVYTLPLSVLHGDSVGYRVRPQNIIAAGYTLLLDDAGKLLIHNDTSTPSVIVDTNANKPFPNGTVIYFRNTGTGTLTFSRESGVTLRKAGSATSQDVVVAQWGEGELVKEDTDVWYMTGTGLT